MVTGSGVDFDHRSDELSGPQYWDAVRELQRLGPLVWVENYEGYWAATRYAVIRRIAQDHQSFSSGQGVTLGRAGPDIQPYIMPVEIDPPRQRLFRRNVNPHLSPNAVVDLAEPIRAIVDERIDDFIERGSCDIVADFARFLPGTVFFRLLIGVDDEALEHLEPLARTLSFDADNLKRAEAASAMRRWARSVLDESGPSEIVHAVRGLADSEEEFADHELESGLQNLAQGGIGTSTQLIGSIVVHLCRQPDVQQRVRDDLDLVPSLVEETLRLEPPVPMLFRTATRDLVIEGQQIREGERVGLLYGAGNRDPDVFERPDELDLARPVNPHLTFGLGVHRCIGSNLARLQVRVAVEQLLTGLSPFELAPGGRVTYRSASQRGPSSVPLTFNPGVPVGAVPDARGGER